MRNAKKIRAGKTTRIRKVKKKSKKAGCAMCNRRLFGIDLSGPKTAKKPNRPLGSKLCPICATRVIKEAIKVKEGIKSIETVQPNLKGFVEEMMRKI